MKKVLSIISMILLIFLVGCSSKDNSTTNNSQNTSNVTESNKSEESNKNKEDSTKSVEVSKFYTERNGVKLEVTYYHKGDKVLKQTAYNIMNYKQMGVTKAEFVEYAKPIMEKYKGIEGLEQKVDFQDDAAYETITVDYTKVDKNKLIGLPGTSVDTTTSDVSFEKAENYLLDQGYVKEN